MFKPSGSTIYEGRGVGGEIETTALAAWGLFAAKTEPALVEGALRHLAARRDPHGGWHSTQGTILALRALLMTATPAVDKKISVKVNGQSAGELSLAASALQPARADLGARLRPGANVVELQSDAAALFQLVTVYTLPWSDRDAEARAPLSLSVEYGRSKLRLGEILPIDLKVTYRRPEASGMVLVAVGVPAGTTPLIGDLDALVAARKIGRYELEAGKVNLYLDGVRAGAPVELALRLKATGRVRTRGAESAAWLYYQPELRAEASPAPLSVD